MPKFDYVHILRTLDVLQGVRRFYPNRFQLNAVTVNLGYLMGILSP